MFIRRVFVITFLLCLTSPGPKPAFTQPAIIEQLNNSPRHHEWAAIEVNGRTLYNFVVYPQISENATAVIVIHENRGLTDWVRYFADQMAGAGYIVIAPDLLSGFNAKYKRTSDFPSVDDARNAIYELNPDQVTADLNAVQNYVKNLPAANGKTVVAGFCWGGAQSFRFATNNPDMKAAFVFYGTPPENKDDLARIQVPVYGFYGGEDQRVNATIPATEELMRSLGKSYEYEIYPGADHAFMRKGDDPEGSVADKAAHDAAWQKLKDILTKLNDAG